MKISSAAPARAYVRDVILDQQFLLCTQLWMRVWATPVEGVHDLGTALCTAAGAVHTSPETLGCSTVCLWIKTAPKEI